MIGNEKELFLIWDNNALTSGENRLAVWGAPGSGNSRLNAEGVLFLTWGFISSHGCRITVEGSLDDAFTVTNTLYDLPVLAGVYSTPYQLAAPLNYSGYVMLTMPIIRVRIRDTATANHTYTNLYVKAWW